MKDNTKTFCVLPFYGYEFPLRTPCCLLTNKESLETVKTMMLAGDRPASCSTCWDLEDAGVESDRLLKNKMIDYYRDLSLENLIAECEQGNNRIISYKIDTSNTCNGACVTCVPSSSSTWIKIFQENAEHTQHTSWQILPETIDFVDYANAKTISFRGGEPFLSKTNFSILEKLIEHNNTDCFISFVTNGSSTLSRRQKEILLNFNNLNFCISIDGIGPIFEFLRWPLRWGTVLENISWAKENNIDISVSYTVSNMNLLYMDDTIKWFKENNLAYIINPVEFPVYFKPSTLPKEIKSQLKNTLMSDIPVEWFEHSTEDDKNFELFKIEIQKQDSWKKISIRNYLPEFAEMVGL
jgi:sulfatase maturation enzyme AslB (radical SAM superfamily)